MRRGGALALLPAMDAAEEAWDGSPDEDEPDPPGDEEVSPPRPEETGEKLALIGILPDDALNHVFAMLAGIRCVCRAIRVCRRWERVGRRIPWRSADLDCCVKLNPQGPVGSARRVLTSELRILRVSCHRDARPEKISVYCTVLNSSSPDWVNAVVSAASWYCPNLESLSVKCWGPLCFELLPTFPRLRTLVVEDRRGNLIGAHLLFQLRQRCRRLERLNVSFPNGQVSPSFRDGLVLLMQSLPRLCWVQTTDLGREAAQKLQKAGWEFDMRQARWTCKNHIQ